MNRNRNTNTDTKTKTRPKTKTKDETAAGILRICAMYRMIRMIYIIYKGISKVGNVISLQITN